MVTVVPSDAPVGETEVIVGPEVVIVKLVEEVPVPDGVVTEIVPVVAPEGTVVVICVELLTVNEVAAVPLNLTEAAPVKFVPVIVTLVPTAPLVGLKLVTVGVAPPELDPFSATMTIAQ
jgi:hypothetical protein